MNLSPLSAQNMPAMVDFLSRRRSSKVLNLTTPGPDDAQIETILTIAARVPDHGKLAPWRFIVFKDAARHRIGAALSAAFLEENPDASPAKLALEAEKFLRAPLVIAVIHSVRDGKAPLWEQELSTGAACFNLCLAANAQGFASTWLTEWMAYSPAFQKSLGLDTEKEKCAGFIYIGTAKTAPEERERPKIESIVTYW